MKIIPVIDLMHGEVVHARLGQRQHYQPIQSLLCNSSQPINVVNALIELYPFKQIYIADLDAITGQGNHTATILQIQAQHPDLEIWLDAGIHNAAALAIWHHLRVTHVIGSENIASIPDLKEINQTLRGSFVLSLDFNQTGFLGHPELQTAAEYWPDKLLVMTLSRVGSQKGADIERLQAVQALACGREIYAAGGVRNNEDIHMLQNLNLAGVLVATALHNKNLNPRYLYQPSLQWTVPSITCRY
jgi:phosphoribosylformimino-5-aminoimidazole carboxamide ribotide isomerase